MLMATPLAASEGWDRPCDTHELQQGEVAYNRLVCDGLSAYDRGQYWVAIEAFEIALNERLFEYPNFELLPRLALAYHLVGETEKAQETIALAELTFSIFFGVIRCREEDNNYWLAMDWSGEAFEHPLAERAINRMCGAILEPIYEPNSMGWIKRNCVLMGVLEEAQARIGGS